jgi:succinate dehydrogenase/fumarate reductase flavoprotein subunit
MTTLEELADEIVETDILIVGGGLGGKMAAIRAKEKGNVDVTLVEKANMSRSGDVPSGLDDYPGVAHPKINGVTPEEYGRMRAEDLAGLVRTDLSITTAKWAIKPIAILEQIGVRIKEDDGNFWIAAGRIGGALQTRVYDEKEKKYNRVPGDFIKYRGGDLHPLLAAEVRRRGVRVIERTMLANLITKNGAVVGATAINTRNGKFYVFKSKFVILATGPAGRLEDSSPYVKSPDNLFYQWHCPANSGGGHIAAYKAGADLVNMEFIQVDCSNLGKYLGPNGEHLAPILNTKGENMHQLYDVMKMEGKTGGMQGNRVEFSPDLANPAIERDVLKVTWAGVRPDSPERMMAFNSSQEAPANFAPVAEKGGLRAIDIEITPWIKSFVRSMSGVMFDQNGETSVKGLFVAGDVVGALPLWGSAGAFGWGYKIADYLRELAPDVEKTEFDKEQIDQVEAEKKRIFAPIAQKDGLNPLEVENLARKLVINYVGIHRLEPRMKQCLEHLQSIKEDVIPLVRARDYHELMRAIELQEIVELAQIHTQSSIMRTETRHGPAHHRMDYPETDDRNWQGKVIVANNKNGKPNFTVKKLEEGV